MQYLSYNSRHFPSPNKAKKVVFGMHRDYLVVNKTGFKASLFWAGVEGDGNVDVQHTWHKMF